MKQNHLPARSPSLGRGAVFFLATLGLIAGTALLPAGEPIPDIDVILEQNPGGVIAIEVRPDDDFLRDPAIQFDSVRLSGDKALADLALKNLPAGWGLRRDGKRLVLSGPAVAPPVRFQLETQGARPERVSVELLDGKAVRFSRMKINPRIVPQRVVAGTVVGTVRLPPQVSAGETLALRSLPDATVPPGGRWVINGTVSEPWDEDELRTARTIVNTTRSNIDRSSGKKAATATATPSRPLLLQGEGGCQDLAPLAAVLLARDQGRAGGEVLLTDLSPQTPAQHDVAMGSIRNLKFFFTVTNPPPGIAINEEEDLVTSPDKTTPGIAINEEEDLVASPEKTTPGIAINEEEDLVTSPDKTAPGIAINEEEDLVASPGQGVQRFAVKEESLKASQVAPPKGRDRETGKKEAWTASGDGASHRLAWTWAEPAALSTLGEEGASAPRTAAFEGEPVAGGCRFTPRQPNDLDLARWARQQAPKTNKLGGSPGKPAKSEIHFVTLPGDLRPGDRISVRYVDEWGDSWIEVPEVPEVEVIPPAADGPFIESATPYAVAGDQICVCGTFSALDAVAEFSIGGQPAEVVSSSGRVVWLQSSADLVGPALIQAVGLKGEAATDLLQVRAELDQEHLFSGESKPLRITIEGSEAALPIHLTNGSPQAIELEGGPDQWTETSGGAVNQVVRQVRGLQRGTFQLSWELKASTCPCAGSAAP
jgi:hypothetical protein